MAQHPHFPPSVLEKALSYHQYRKLHERLVEEQTTTGENKSEKMVEYTALNLKRTRRWEKTYTLTEEQLTYLHHYPRKLQWVVLTEPWCGDAAQNVPLIAKIAQESPAIELCFLLRDEHPGIMDAYLTNGGRSIPKLICLDAETYEELGTWGPRPAPAQKMVMDYKANPESKDVNTLIEEVQGWYNRDKGAMLYAELKGMLDEWRAGHVQAAPPKV